MKMLKYVVIALLTLGVITPAGCLFAADSTTDQGQQCAGQDQGKKKTKAHKDKKTPGSTTNTTSNATGKKKEKKKKSGDTSADGSSTSDQSK